MVNFRLLFTLANLLTASRFVLAPFLALLYLRGDFKIAFWLMLFLGVTDWLDGFFARKFNQESLFGKVFDPIADKTLMITMFATLGYLKAIPFSFVFLCLLRDVLILMGSFAMFSKNAIRNANPTKASKINTLLQILVILVVTYRLQHTNISLVFLSAENILIVLTSVFTFASGLQYTKIFWRFLKNT